MLWSYIGKRLRRNVGQLLLLVSMIIAVTVLLFGLHQYRAEMEARLDQVYDEFEIRCTVTEAGGAQITGLRIKKEIIALFEPSDGKLLPYVKDVFLIREVMSSLVGETPIKLYATTDPAAAPQTEGFPIVFYEGYTSEDFAGEEALCVVSKPMLRTVDESSNITVQLDRYGTVEFRVIGYYNKDESAVYASWDALNDVFRNKGVNTTANSMSFTVADNRQLNELKQMLSEFFAPASTVYQGGSKPGLIIDDALFRDQVTILERGILLMQIVQTLILLLSISIGCLLAYLNIRTRRLELAVMRSLGTRRGALYTEVLCEHAMFCLLGVALAILGITMFAAVPNAQQFKLIGIFIFCYLLGVAVAVWQVTSGKIMQTLKGKE